VAKRSGQSPAPKRANIRRTSPTFKKVGCRTIGEKSAHTHSGNRGGEIKKAGERVWVLRHWPNSCSGPGTRETPRRPCNKGPENLVHKVPQEVWEGSDEPHYNEEHPCRNQRASSRFSRIRGVKEGDEGKPSETRMKRTSTKVGIAEVSKRG